MPYSIVTKDGIQLDNIPDDMPKDDPRLKALVAERRQQNSSMRMSEGVERRKLENPEEYDSTSSEYQKKYGPTSGMTTTDKVRANVGAGMMNFGVGMAQTALPKAAERAVGLTDEYIDEKRQRDDYLADNDEMYGSRGLQIGGEAVPAFAVPGGSFARGAAALPKVGGALKGLGVGSKVLPTLMAEGAGLGAASGLITPTKSDESAVGNAAFGGLAGAALPVGLMGLKKLAAPFLRSVKEESVAGELGKIMDTSPRAQAQLAQKAAASNRGVGQKQTTAELTQNDDLARLESTLRANPETAPSWTPVDEAARNENWTALAGTLGDDATVAAAKKATDAYIQTTKPAVMKRMNKAKLSDGIKDLLAGAKGKLAHSEANRANWSSVVYQKLREEIKASNRSPDALWNVRKMLREWQEGTPPPGFEGTRAPKGDRAIQEAVAAIDETLNRASNGTWSKFLAKMGEHAQKETAQKSGQNIRNALVGEITGEARGATTKAGSPVISRAKLATLLEKYGKNEFGETLDHAQRDVIDQVMTKLRMGEIADRVRASSTRGGSQTAPLLASLAKQQGAELGGGNFTAIAGWFSKVNRSKRQEILNQVLQEPADAIALMKMAEKLKRPLTKPEKALVYAARAVIGAPVQASLAAGVFQSPAQEVSQ
jgi:hypothetical protein